MIAARGVAELLHEIGQHLLQHPRVHGCGGVVVHVDGQPDSVRGDVLCLGDRLYIGAHDCSPAFYVIVTSSAGFLVSVSSCEWVSSFISEILMRRKTCSRSEEHTSELQS